VRLLLFLASTARRQHGECRQMLQKKGQITA
jgi:hypothetical protein